MDFLLVGGGGARFFDAGTCFPDFDDTGGSSSREAWRPRLRTVNFAIIDGVVVETRFVDEDDRVTKLNWSNSHFFFKVLILTVCKT